MLAIGEVAATLGVTTNGVRKWCKEYKEFLSPTASPPEGQTRIFTDDDVGMLALIQQMKRAGAEPDTIKAALINGERGVVSQGDSTGGDTSLALLEIARLEGQLLQLQDERRRLAQQLTEQRERETKLIADQTRLQVLEERVQALQAAEEELRERAVRAETELSLLRGQQAPQTPAALPAEAQGVGIEVKQERPLSRWEKWFGRR